MLKEKAWTQGSRTTKPDMACGGISCTAPAGLSWHGAHVWEDRGQQHPVPIEEVLLTCPEQAGGILDVFTA